MNIPSWDEITYQKDGNEKVDFRKLKALLKTCSAGVQTSEICQAAVKHFEVFHATTPNDKYISFFFSGKNQKFQLNYTKKAITPELLTIFVEFSILHKLNLYISEFCYLTGLNRREKNVFSTNVITMDLDKKDLDMSVELPNIQAICDKNGLNLSAVFGSGRGHYLVFKLKEPYVCVNNMVKLKRWKYNYDLICDMFQDYGADYKCKDISRVFRLIGSYNYKDDTQYETKILHTWNVDNEYLNIPCCKETADNRMFEAKSAEELLGNSVLPKRKKSVVIDSTVEYQTLTENKVFKSQNKKRISDLLHLLSMRYDHLGDRHTFLYVLINQLNVSGYSYKDALTFILEKVNPRFSLPESEYEIVRQLQSIYSENKKKIEKIDSNTVEYVENHYHSSTTQWIIDTLKITPEEQDKLSIIKSKDKLHQLRQEKRLTRFRSHTQNKKKEQKNKVNQIAENNSISVISEKTNLSKSSIYRKLDKTPKQIQIEKENIVILQLKANGLTNTEIAQEIGLSAETIKKRLQKINKEQCLITEAIEQNDNYDIESVLNTFSDLISDEFSIPFKTKCTNDETIQGGSISSCNDPPDKNTNTSLELPW